MCIHEGLRLAVPSLRSPKNPFFWVSISLPTTSLFRRFPSNSWPAFICSIATTESIEFQSDRVSGMVGTISEMSLLAGASSLSSFLRTGPKPVQVGKPVTVYEHSLGDESSVLCFVRDGRWFMSGRGVVDCVAYRLLATGTTISDHKKFESGIFSDLRNLRQGIDYQLEPAKVSISC